MVRVDTFKGERPGARRGRKETMVGRWGITQWRADSLSLV
jgi:hypothetical protein